MITLDQLIGFIFLMSFVSIYDQYAGLYGWNGLLPIIDEIPRSESKRIDAYFSSPTLFLFAFDLGVSVDALANFVILLGIASSSLIALGIHSGFRLCSFICWITYLSIFSSGKTFMSFQWDILLLEVGFLTVLAGPSCSKTSFMNWCYRFLAFKLMFESGVVKLMAQCPTWNDLTALEFHFATQCIPTPLAFFAHQLPPVLQRLAVGLTLVIEIPLALMLIAPFHIVRRVGAVMQLILQLSILLTGNYNFFNILTGYLMIKVWDDSESSNILYAQSRTKGEDFRGIVPLITGLWASVGNSSPGKAVQYIAAFSFVALTVHMMLKVEYLSGPQAGEVSSWELTNIALKMSFKEVEPYLSTSCKLAFGSCVVCLSMYALHDLDAIWQFSGNIDSDGAKGGSMFSLTSKVWESLVVTAGAIVGILWLCVSAVPLAEMADVTTFLPSFSMVLYRQSKPFHLVSGYGLFRRMTGVGTVPTRYDLALEKDGVRETGESLGKQWSLYGIRPSVVARPEIVLEGLRQPLDEDEDEVENWIEIPFLYKPTDCSRSPPWVAPHQPRLDWHMWFAALGSYQGHPWLISLVDKLLDGNNPQALSLIDRKRYPFWDNAPMAIRARLFSYDFPRYNTSWARKIPGVAIICDSDRIGARDNDRDIESSEMKAKKDSRQSKRNRKCEKLSSAWWVRSNPREYLPAIERNNPSVEDFLSSHGIPKRPYRPTSELYKDCQLSSKAALKSTTGRGSFAQSALGGFQTLACNSIHLRDWIPEPAFYYIMSTMILAFSCLYFSKIIWKNLKEYVKTFWLIQSSFFRSYGNKVQRRKRGKQA